jgi:hypothetical protein
MKSVRLDDNLQAKLKRAAQALAMTQSEFLRDALARRCDEVLGDSLEQRLAPVVGIVNSSGGRAAHSGVAFRAAMARKRRR